MTILYENNNIINAYDENIVKHKIFWNVSNNIYNGFFFFKSTTLQTFRARDVARHFTEIKNDNSTHKIVKKIKEKKKNRLRRDTRIVLQRYTCSFAAVETTGLCVYGLTPENSARRRPPVSRSRAYDPTGKSSAAWEDHFPSLRRSSALPFRTSVRSFFTFAVLSSSSIVSYCFFYFLIIRRA